MKMYFEDLEEGVYFGAMYASLTKRKCLITPGRMIPHLSTSMRRLPGTLHTAASSPVGVHGDAVGQPFPSLLQSRFLGGSNGISSCPDLCVQATDCIPRLRFSARSRRASRAEATLRPYIKSLIKIRRRCSYVRLCG